MGTFADEMTRLRSEIDAARERRGQLCQHLHEDHRTLEVEVDLTLIDLRHAHQHQSQRLAGERAAYVQSLASAVHSRLAFENQAMLQATAALRANNRATQAEMAASLREGLTTEVQELTHRVEQARDQAREQITRFQQDFATRSAAERQHRAAVAEEMRAASAATRAALNADHLAAAQAFAGLPPARPAGSEPAHRDHKGASEQKKPRHALRRKPIADTKADTGPDTGPNTGRRSHP